MRGLESLTTDIAIAYVWLALSGAAILVGLFAKFRNAGRWAWAVVVAGIGSLGWSVYHIHEPLVLAGLGSDIPQLRQEVAVRGREIARLQQAEKTAREAVQAEHARNAELKARLDAAEKTARGDKERYEQQLASANAELLRERSQHAETKRLLAAAERERTDLNGRLAELNTELAAEKARHGETKERLDAADKTARSDKERYEQQLASANAELLRERSLHAEARGALEGARRDLDDRNKRLVELNTELAGERARHAETSGRLDAAEKTARSDKERYEQQLASANAELVRERSLHTETKRLLAAAQQLGPAHQPKGYAGELYSAVPLGETELVAGKKGTYHALRLFSAARETLPIFDLGSYRLDPTREQEVARAIAELDREVVSVLAANRPVAIFVRGRANNIRFIGPGALLGGPCSGNSISYLPYDDRTKRYASAATQQVLADIYSNQELPNLRAASIACIAKAALQSAELSILQGEISATTDRNAQTAEMFLFTGAPTKTASP